MVPSSLRGLCRSLCGALVTQPAIPEKESWAGHLGLCVENVQHH